MQRQYFRAMSLLLLCVFLFACGETPAESGTSEATALTTEPSATTEKTTAAMSAATSEVTIEAVPDAAIGTDDAVRWRAETVQDAQGMYNAVRFSDAETGESFLWRIERSVYCAVSEADGDSAVVRCFTLEGEWEFDWVDLAQKCLLYHHDDDGRMREFGRLAVDRETMTIYSTGFGAYSWYIEQAVIRLERRADGSLRERASYTVDLQRYNNILRPVPHIVPVREVRSADKAPLPASVVRDGEDYAIYAEYPYAWFEPDEEGTIYGARVRYDASDRAEGPWLESGDLRLEGLTTLYYSAQPIETFSAEKLAAFGGDTEWYIADGGASDNAVAWTFVEREENASYDAAYDYIVLVDAHYLLKLRFFFYYGSEGCSEGHYITDPIAMCQKIRLIPNHND